MERFFCLHCLTVAVARVTGNESIVWARRVDLREADGEQFVLSEPLLKTRTTEPSRVAEELPMRSSGPLTD